MQAPYLDINELIGFHIQSTAEWRRRKAQDFPDDLRNIDAAEELDRLATEVAQLGGSEIHHRICKLAQMNYSIWNDLIDDVSAILRAVGFHVKFDTGAQLLKWLHDAVEKAVRDAINGDSGGVDSPKLEEQVDNDPAVKATKKAYADARAKAYAEARRLI
jgi:hypothetical protein